MKGCGVDGQWAPAESIDKTAQMTEARMGQARIGLLAMAGLAALAACAAPAPVSGPATSQAAPQVLPPAAPKDRLVAAIEAQSCVLTAQNVEAILLDANLTQADLVSLTPELAAEGRAEVAAEGTIRVLTDNCI